MSKKLKPIKIRNPIASSLAHPLFRPRRTPKLIYRRRVRNQKNQEPSDHAL